MKFLALQLSNIIESIQQHHAFVTVLKTLQ
jgi:hypothetical protein